MELFIGPRPIALLLKNARNVHVIRLAFFFCRKLVLLFRAFGD
jgi:hypothetical protein